MKKFNAGQVTTIVANAGIIASILFLAIEVRQNNEFAAAEARRNRSAFVEDTYLRLASNSELASIFLKDQSDEELTALEQVRAGFVIHSGLSNLQWAYQDMSIEDWELFARRWQRLFELYSVVRVYWADNGQDFFHPDFARWFDENVAKQ